MRSGRFIAVLLSGTVISGMWAYGALAADVEAGAPLPAVSAFNGKIELGGGIADIDTLSSDEVFYGAGSLSMPLGDMFGLQVDFAAANAFGETGVGGAGHLFMRDPNTYLFGVIGGAGDVGVGNLAFAGAEAELYMDNITFELAAGYLHVDPDWTSSSDELFAFADVAFYPTENLRFSVGASSVANFESANAAAEYMFSDMPISLKLKGEVGEDDFMSATAGISFYFGGNDPGKSLIRRHREDDPRNRALDIFGKGAAAIGNAPPVVDDEDPECPDGEVWNGESCVPDFSAS